MKTGKFNFNNKIDQFKTKKNGIDQFKNENDN